MNRVNIFLNRDAGKLVSDDLTGKGPTIYG